MRTVLVVDDDPWVREFARDVLAEEGYRVLEATDGEDAIRIGIDHPGPIHLLLSDVVMPGINGCEVAARLTSRRAGMKVMFMSAYDRDSLALMGLDLAGPVIAKPFTPGYLSRRVLMVLDRQASTAPASARSR